MNNTNNISDRDLLVLSRYRAVLELEGLGHSFKEIGEMLNISPQRANQLYKKAKIHAEHAWAEGLDLRARNLLNRIGFRAKSEVAAVFDANPQFFRTKNQNLGPGGLDRLAVWLGRTPSQTYSTLILDFVPVRNVQGEYVALNGNALPTYRSCRVILLDVNTGSQFSAAISSWGSSPVVLESIQPQIDLRNEICKLRKDGVPFLQVAANLELPASEHKRLASDTEYSVSISKEFFGMDEPTCFILHENGFRNLVAVRRGIEAGTLTPSSRRYPWHNMKLGAVRYRKLAEFIGASIPLEFVEFDWATGLHHRCRVILARFGANSVQSALDLINGKQLQAGTPVPGTQQTISAADARILQNWAMKQALISPAKN